MSEVYANSAQFTRFEHPRLPNCGGDLDSWRMVPVRYIKEWQYPRNVGMVGGGVFKTVRISEHKWPMAGTFRCRDGYGTVEWPLPQPAATRTELVNGGLIVPWNFYPDPDCILPCVGLDEAAWGRHSRGYSGPNDGLPADYLDFWLGTAEESERSDD